MFVLGYCAGIMTCVRLAWVRGMFSVNNLAGDSSILGRVWNSLTRSGGPTADQSGQKTTGHVITSLAVCRDHKFWIWSLTSYDCILVTVTELVSVCLHHDNDSILIYVFMLVSGDGKGGGMVAVYLCFQQHSEFLYCRLETSAGQLTVSPMSAV